MRANPRTKIGREKIKATGWKFEMMVINTEMETNKIPHFV
jgi:hypothetical protein